MIVSERGYMTGIISFVMASPSQTSHGSLDLAVRGSQRAFSEE
jgi:hypothetical protein